MRYQISSHGEIRKQPAQPELSPNYGNISVLSHKMISSVHKPLQNRCYTRCLRTHAVSKESEVTRCHLQNPPAATALANCGHQRGQPLYQRTPVLLAPE